VSDIQYSSLVVVCCQDEAKAANNRIRPMHPTEPRFFLMRRCSGIDRGGKVLACLEAPDRGGIVSPWIAESE
jgi:hypothetical protein